MPSLLFLPSATDRPPRGFTRLLHCCPVACLTLCLSLSVVPVAARLLPLLRPFLLLLLPNDYYHTFVLSRKDSSNGRQTYTRQNNSACRMFQKKFRRTRSTRRTSDMGAYRSAIYRLTFPINGICLRSSSSIRGETKKRHCIEQSGRYSVFYPVKIESYKSVGCLLLLTIVCCLNILSVVSDRN